MSLPVIWSPYECGDLSFRYLESFLRVHYSIVFSLLFLFDSFYQQSLPRLYCMKIEGYLGLAAASRSRRSTAVLTRQRDFSDLDGRATDQRAASRSQNVCLVDLACGRGGRGDGRGGTGGC